MPKYYLKLGHGRFLTLHFHFINHKSSYKAAVLNEPFKPSFLFIYGFFNNADIGSKFIAAKACEIKK
jgi:hypothetical protein